MTELETAAPELFSILDTPDASAQLITQPEKKYATSVEASPYRTWELSALYLLPVVAQSSIPRAQQRRVEFAFDHSLDELSHPIADASLDRIKPIVEKINGRLGFRLRKRRMRGIALHGVVSSPALRRRVIRG